MERMEHVVAMNLDATALEHATATLEDLKIVSHCCAHLTHLIDDVLLLSKMGMRLATGCKIRLTHHSADNNFLVITPVPSRIADSIQRTLAMFASEMLSKKITCSFEISAKFQELGVDTILTDPARISQLLINLLTNAIKVSWCLPIRNSQLKVDVAHVVHRAGSQTQHQGHSRLFRDPSAPRWNSRIGDRSG